MALSVALDDREDRILDRSNRRYTEKPPNGRIITTFEGIRK